MKAFINLVPGVVVEYDGRHYAITSILTLETVLAKDEETGEHRELHIKDIIPISELTQSEENKQVELSLIPEDDWNDASGWADKLRPLLSVSRRTTDMVDKVARDAGVCRTTVYRKLKTLEKSGKASSLVPQKSSGGKGKSRLVSEAEVIIRATIIDLRFTKGKEKRPLDEIYSQIKSKLERAKLDVPHINTIQRRLNSIRKEKEAEQQAGRQETGKRNIAYPGHFPGANFPLAVVQIDHTKLDIILVDDVDREPIGRPWITLAIDVFSRTVPGFYISLDPPGDISVGLCIAHAILLKDKWLAKHNINIAWPTWGIMSKLHADNAGEFHSNMLKRACKEYGIDLEWRPVKQPRYGAHIESLLGTFAEKIHQLSGTTFSNPKERGKYDSEKHANMTITSLEEWFTRYVAGIYHQEVATEVDLQQYLQPLGLWRRRAASLEKLANEMAKRRGKFPERREEIEQLPNVGQYIANAILLFCHGDPQPLLDVNMARVLERFFGPRKLADIRYDPYLQSLAKAVVSSKNPHVINWAILDHATLICKISTPLCTVCPVVLRCKFANSNKALTRG